MTDYISRQAAIDALADLYWMDERLLNFKKEIDKVYDKILNLPSAQQEPKHGKWMTIGNTGLAACECGYITDRYSIYNYCPNCGAKMERSEE